MRRLYLLALCFISHSAHAAPICTPSEIEIFTAHCAEIGAELVHAADFCARAVGPEHCTSFPWPTKVFVVNPARLECRSLDMQPRCAASCAYIPFEHRRDEMDCFAPLDISFSGLSIATAIPAGLVVAQKVTVTQDGAPKWDVGVQVVSGGSSFVGGRTDASGEFVFSYVPPAYATTETVTAHCDGCTAPATKTITVDAAELMCTP